jgi:hypothetical protein
MQARGRTVERSYAARLSLYRLHGSPMSLKSVEGSMPPLGDAPVIGSVSALPVKNPCPGLHASMRHPPIGYTQNRLTRRFVLRTKG